MPSTSPPMAGLAAAACADPALAAVSDLVGRAEARLVGPASVRAFVAATVAHSLPLLVVTATGRDADDLTGELTEILGDAVAQFPSWETLPHERLSPSADTVGRRLEVLRRLARPDDPDYGPPLRVVVTTVRSLMQPMAPQLGELEPIGLRVGSEYDFDGLTERLVEFAYTRVDMVGKRGEFAVRGGILDVFSPTADHPVRVEFWGDEVTELRPFSVADQRSLPEVEVDALIAPPCRELLLTEAVRDRAATLAADNPADAALVEMLDKLAAGIPVEGMEALLPVLRARRAATAHRGAARRRARAAVRPGEDPHPRRRPGAHGTGVPRGVVDRGLRGRCGAAGRVDAAARRIDLAASAYRAIADIEESAHRGDHPWWTLSPLASRRLRRDRTRRHAVLPLPAAPPTSWRIPSRCCARTP